MCCGIDQLLESRDLIGVIKREGSCGRIERIFQVLQP